MNVSTLINRAIETSFNSNDVAETMLKLANRIAKSLLHILDHIGNSIALGEAGDLEDADAFRRNNSGN